MAARWARHRRSTGWQKSAWLAVLVVGELFYQILRRTTLQTGNPHLLPGMVLVGSLVVPVTFLTYLWARPGRQHLTLPAALVAALAGGCASIALAAGLEQLALARADLSTPVVAVVEEAAKLGVTAALLSLVVHRTARDGLLMGAACGAGFAVVETLGYAFVDYLQPGGGMRALDNDLLWRSLFAPATHLTWAALTGSAWGYAASRRWRWPGFALLAATFLLATTLHVVWDSTGSTGVYIALTVVGLALLAGCLRRTGCTSQSDEASPTPEPPAPLGVQ